LDAEIEPVLHEWDPLCRRRGNGRLAWKLKTGNGFSSPACCFYSRSFPHGVFYVGADGGKVEAVKVSNGHPLWRFNTGGDVDYAPRITRDAVYFDSGSGGVYALDPATGVKKWKFHLPGDNAVESTPAVKDGVVYVGADDSTLYALRASDGKKLWAYGVAGGNVSSPAVGGASVFASCGTESQVVTPCHDVFATRRTTGANVWTHTTGGSVYSSPALANGVVYVGSFDHRVYALRSTTGAKVWSFTTGGIVKSSATVAICTGSMDRGCRPA
jgi:eukaryotic-like serine/threonine-protein kinase